MILSGSIKYIGTILEGYQTQNFDSGRIYYFTNETPGQYAIYDVEGGRLIETVGLRTFNKCFEGLNLPKKPKPTPQPKQTINTTILPIGEITLTVNDLFDSDGETFLDVTLDVLDMTFDGSLYYDDNGEFVGHDLTLSSINHDADYLPGARLDYVLEGLEHEFDIFFDDVPNMLNFGQINEGLNLPKKPKPTPQPKPTINTTILPIGEITLTVNDLFNSDGDTVLDVTLDVFDMTFDGSLYYDDNGEFVGHDLTLSSITHDSNYLPGAGLDYVLEGLEHEFDIFFEDVPNMLNFGQINEGLNLPKKTIPGGIIGSLYLFLINRPFAQYCEVRLIKNDIIVDKNNKRVVITEGYSQPKGDVLGIWVSLYNEKNEDLFVDPNTDKLYRQTIEDIIDNYVFDPNDLMEGLNLRKKRIPQVGDVVRFYRGGDEFSLGTIKHVRNNAILIQLPTNTDYLYKRKIKDQNSEYPLRAWWFDGEQPNDIIYEGLNIPKKTEPIELTTELLPIIDVCMYGTVLDANEFIFETEMMSDEGAEKYWEYFDMDIYKNYILTRATNFIEQEIAPHLKEMSIGVIGIDVHEINSPNYYNYRCDQLFYDLLVSSSFNWLILNDINNQDQEELNRFLYESYRSYPGFSSHMPQSVNSLKAAITDNDERERGVAAYLAFKLKDELETWQEAFYDYAREDHSDLDFLREDTPGDIIDKMLEELNGNEVDWTEDDDAEDGELIQEGLNLPKKLPFTISDVIIKLGQKFSLHHVDYSMDDDDDSDPYQVSFSIFLNINNNDRVVHFETFNLRQGIRVPIRDNKTKWNVHSTEFSQNIFTDDFNELLYKVSEFIQSELDRLNNTEDEMLQEGFNLPKKKSIDLNTLRPTLIKWLMNEYTEESAEDQIDNAKIKIDGDIVTIVYDNGVKDVVRIIPRINNDPEVEQLSEGLNLPKRLDAKKYKVTVDYEEGEDYLTPTELFDLANSITVELEDDTLEEIVTIDDAIDRLFLAGYNVTLMDELNEGLNLPKKQSSQSWFQSILNQTTGPHTTPNYPNSLFYKLDDDVIFEYNRKNGYFWVEYYSMWSVFEGKFNLNYSEIQALIKPMVEEHYKLESVTPFIGFGLCKQRVEEHYKLESVNEN